MPQQSLDNQMLKLLNIFALFLPSVMLLLQSGNHAVKFMQMWSMSYIIDVSLPSPDPSTHLLFSCHIVKENFMDVSLSRIQEKTLHCTHQTEEVRIKVFASRRNPRVQSIFRVWQSVDFKNENHMICWVPYCYQKCPPRYKELKDSVNQRPLGLAYIHA